MLKAVNYIFFGTAVLILTACGKAPSGRETTSEQVSIYPDYTGITIPPNIAPLNFSILNQGDRYKVFIGTPQGSSIRIRTASGKVKIPERSWNRLLKNSAGGNLEYTVFRKKKGKSWELIGSFVNRVSGEEIDPYIVFRKILPANILWKEMGIYQRSLESFREDPVMVNSLTDENCMNCHSFNGGDPDQMLFHMRGPYGGTLIRTGDEIRFLDTRTEDTRASAVYPSWHPGGKLIAFSVNMINQGFHASMDKSSYVLDKYSDIILFDLEANSLTRPAELATKNLENLPAWSADGEQLYFISTGPYSDTIPYFKTRYSLLRIDFDPPEKKFGSIDTLLNSEKAGMSITFPRERPQGNLLSFVGLDYGYFSINNREADIYFLELNTGEIQKPEINSAFTESYPSWSANGSWLMFVSKRDDGLISQPWFCYVDRNGTAAKPFVLPQKDPDFYKDQMYNFNRPEFAADRVRLHPRRIFRVVREGAGPVVFDEKASVSAVSGATVTLEEKVEQPGSIYHHD
jgi:hypothetical protein